jgi:hypothetical protein
MSSTQINTLETITKVQQKGQRQLFVKVEKSLQEKKPPIALHAHSLKTATLM